MTKHEMQLNSGKTVFLAKDPHFVKSTLNADLSVGCLQIQDTMTRERNCIISLCTLGEVLTCSLCVN